MGSLINFLKFGKLGLTMYGNHGGGEGSCSIITRCGAWWIVVFGGGVPTNNELVNATPGKKAEEGAFLLCLREYVGRGSIPPTIGGRPCSQREHRCGGDLAIVKMTLYLKRRECRMVHNKLNVFPNF